MHAVRSYLLELLLEHRSRGLGGASTENVQERLRVVVKDSARLQRELRERHALSKDSRRGSFGTARNLYATMKDQEDKQRDGNFKRSRAEYLENKARRGREFDSLPSDDSVKQSYMQQFERLRLECRTRVLASGHVDQQHEVQDGYDADAEDQFAVAQGSWFSIGCSKFPLAPSLFAEFRARHGRSLRGMYETLKSSGRFSKVLLPEHVQHSVFRKIEDKKQYDRFLKMHPNKCCLEVFGSGICRTADATIMKQLKFIHASLWTWVNSQWISDDLEGCLLARFSVWAAGMVMQVTFAVLARRFGNPRKMAWLLLQRPADESIGEENLLPRTHVSYHLVSISSVSLATLLATWTVWYSRVRRPAGQPRVWLLARKEASGMQRWRGLFTSREVPVFRHQFEGREVLILQRQSRPLDDRCAQGLPRTKNIARGFHFESIACADGVG